MAIEQTDKAFSRESAPWRELLAQFAAPVPQRLTDVSPWQPHLPFGAVLVRLLKPSTIVELGVHKGDSYCGFCEAVVNAQLKTACFGIDTWKGDPHASLYGPEVLDELRKYHDARYASFSSLIPTTFDEAISSFADATIDLLHIDGLHTYEAVRHDFDTWVSKVRDGGIVLLHDIAVRERDFGAWRLFSELEDEYLTCSFPFASGLGIVGIGDVTRTDAGALFSMSGDDWHMFSQALWVLGHRIRLIEIQNRALALAHEDNLDADDAAVIPLSYRHRINTEALRNQATIAELEVARNALTAELEAARHALDALRRDHENLQASLRRKNNLETELDRQIVALHDSLASVSDSLASTRHELTRAMNSTSWRVTAPLRWASGLRRRVKNQSDTPGSAADLSTSPAALPEPKTTYFDWIARFDTLTPDRLAALTADAQQLASQGPVFSIILPVFNPDLALLREAIASVTSQAYPRWELCIVDDHSSVAGVRNALRDIVDTDDRISLIERPENGHISQATNTGIEHTTGEWLAFLDQDDRLASTALYVIAEEIVAAPGLSFIYSDEDKLDATGARSDPYFKPPPNRALFLGQNVACHLSVYRRSVVQGLGGLRSEFDGAQDYDLALRVLDTVPISAVRHVPRVLYHWRATVGSTADSIDAKPYARKASRRAVGEHLERNGIRAVVGDSPSGAFNTVRPPADMFADDGPLVSIIIPTRDHLRDLRRCVHSITSRSTYRNFEIIVIDNGSGDSSTLAYLDQISRDGIATVLRDNREFNYSRLNNQAAAHANGDFLLLLNNDTEVDAPGWLEAMLFWFQWDDVGTAGAKLLYPDGGVQHGGIILGVGGVAGHAQKGASDDEPGYFGRLEVACDVDGNTGACMLVRKSVFDRLCGLDEHNLIVAFNDVDFCLRVSDLGLRHVWTPDACLLHHESRSRGNDAAHPVKAERARREVEYMHWRWGRRLTADRNYSPNLTLQTEDFGLAFPPRVPPITQILPPLSAPTAESDMRGAP